MRAASRVGLDTVTVTREMQAPRPGEDASRLSKVKQIGYIMSNAPYLSLQNRKDIMTLIFNDLGEGFAVVASDKKDEVNFNLDVVAEASPELITQIYGVVKGRREQLDRPAGSN